MRLPVDGNVTVTGEFKEKAALGTGLKDALGVARHIGLDVRATVGTPVYAPGNGVVTQSYTALSGNQVIELRVGDKLWRIMHLSERRVGAGSHVSEGQLIAKSGKSGGVAPHLHTDVRRDGTPWNASLSNFFDPRTVIAEANRPTQVSGQNIGKTIHLSKTVDKWAFYRPGTALPLKRVSRAGELSPKKWGGLSYTIVGNPGPNTYEVNSPSLGRIWIYADEDATIK